MIKRMVLLLFALIVASCTFASGSPEELNVYSLIPSEYSSKILLDFSNEFDIDVNIKQTTIAELQSTVDDDTWGDIILGGSGLNHQLFADEGWLVEGINQIGINENLFRLSKDNLWIVIDMNSLVFLTNNDFLDKFSLSAPNAWNDILYPSYKDQIILSNPTKDGRIGRIYNLELLYGPNGAIEFQKALDKNVVYYYNNKNEGSELVATGEVGFTITDSETALAIAKQGKPVTISFPEEGIIYGEKCCSILKSGRNYNNAKTLLAWFLSDNYIGSIVKNKIPFVLPAGVESFKDEYIDYTKVNFLKTDFNLKLKNHDKYIEDFRNYVLKDRVENF